MDAHRLKLNNDVARDKLHKSLELQPITPTTDGDLKKHLLPDNAIFVSQIQDNGNHKSCGLICFYV